jgi:ATP-dependent DNA helicase RecG
VHCLYVDPQLVRTNLTDLIAQPESNILDFKRDLSSLPKTVKTILAIANTANGVVVIGISDDKTPFGLSQPLKDEERLAEAVKSSIEPLLLVSIKHATVQKKSILVVEIPFSPRPYYLVSEGIPDGVYVREGSTNAKADIATVEELRRQGALQSFDLETIPAVAAEQLDQRRIEVAFGKRPPDAKLDNLGVIVDHAGRKVATRAGVLLFGTDEQRRDYAGDARIRCAAFRGTSKSQFLDKAAEFDELSVLEALEGIQAFLNRNLREGASVNQQLRRRNISEYHPNALRELLVNAVAHANYAATGTPISVQLFSNRVEIISPGRFPPGTTVQSLKEGMSKIRNRGIANVLHHLQIMEKWGSGWDRIQDTFADGYPEPVWQDVGGSVKVTLPVHPYFSASGSGVEKSRRDRKPEILTLLKAGPASADEIANSIGVTVRRAAQLLRDMAEEGTIEPTETATRSPNQKWRFREAS